jgi:glycosyltransferase involved in cell wall biosynthesis
VNLVHVAVDAHNLVRDDRGIGRYARAVLSRALHEPGFRWTLVVRDLFPNRDAFARALGASAVQVARRVPRDADVVWFPWNGTFLGSEAPAVATVHDAAPFAFPAANPRIRATEQGPFLTTAATARRILVQSAFTAGEVERWLRVERERIAVTPLAVDPIFSPGSADTLPDALRGRCYVLHVGAHDPRKNTATLVAGHERAFPGGDVTLVFTRKPPELPRGAIVAEAPDDASLVALYRGAQLVALPSTYEGFGFPLLEAMACGAPVLAARAGALPEIGADAAAYVDKADDVSAWSDALRALLADGDARAELAARGRARASTFSWERCTAQTLEVLRETATTAARL